jgi:hypothetical protein
MIEVKMEIPLNAQVECTDGIVGRSVYVLINPVGKEVTHLVVRRDSPPNIEYTVPTDFVSETIANTIRLRCSKAELEKMEPFNKTVFIEERVPERVYGYGSGMNGIGSAFYMPYVTPDISMQVAMEQQQIPPGELTVRRGTRVEATDGYVGHVDEFVVNPENCHITHLVLREGHLWGQKDVIIPLSALKSMDITHEDAVVLNIDKHEIESLPTFPVHRLWD